MGEEEGGIWENGIETCIISYKKRIASPGLMQDTGCLGLVHWDDPEGWYGEGGGTGGSGLGARVHPWWMHVDVWQNQYNIVKKKKSIMTIIPILHLLGINTIHTVICYKQ